MNDKDLSELTDPELLVKAKKMKSDSIMHAVLYGLMIGVLIYGVAKNNLGFLTLIPLFLAYKVFNNPENSKNNEELKKLLKERNLN
jgi:cadmium resistance protein CadD (predicted permease)